MKKFLISFLLITILICNSSLHVYASDNGGGGYSRPSSTTDTTGFNDWSLSDKFSFWFDNLVANIAGVTGLVINPLNWNRDAWMELFLDNGNTMDTALNSENYQEWVANMLSVNDNGDLVIDDELADIMYIATTQYIKEETPWYVLKTYKFSDIDPSRFQTHTEYEYFQSFLNGFDASSVIYIYQLYTTSNNTATDNADDYNIGYSCSYYEFVDSDMFIYASSSVENLDNYSGYFKVTSCDKDWLFHNDYLNVYNHTTHNVSTSTFYTLGKHEIEGFGRQNSNWNSKGLFTKYGSEVRVYKTVADMKEYSVGQRPYYMTDKFQDYDINGDNSCIVTESDLSNGSVYGDVYNYIINNYDNPDGLTEDELRDILNDYFGEGSGGSGSGNGSGSSGGSGLGNFLEGLGSLGDGILSILGKLLEYVGKAIDLLSGTVTKVLDLVPKNITN